ncbi:hypothetical protein [Microaceticoccus formicicus]|uniref:hypothetical protein n=1 Tax=Microaceticoccus formicicus TaxID=3118105 RepID=UPI003CD00AD1|nr:hypothetical protein VZL98_02560 [Peptoniphilaceae bacterium AMB_02]
MLKKKILPIGAAALVLIGMTACGQKTDKKKAAATDVNKKPAIVQNKNQKSAPKAEIKKAAPETKKVAPVKKAAPKAKKAVPVKKAAPAKKAPEVKKDEKKSDPKAGVKTPAPKTKNKKNN